MWKKATGLLAPVPARYPQREAQTRASHTDVKDSQFLGKMILLPASPHTVDQRIPKPTRQKPVRQTGNVDKIGLKPLALWIVVSMTLALGLSPSSSESSSPA